MRIHKSEFKTLAMVVRQLAQRDGVSLLGALEAHNHGDQTPGNLRALEARVKRIGRVSEPEQRRESESRENPTYPFYRKAMNLDPYIMGEPLSRAWWTGMAWVVVWCLSVFVAVRFFG